MGLPHRVSFKSSYERILNVQAAPLVNLQIPFFQAFLSAKGILFCNSSTKKTRTDSTDRPTQPCTTGTAEVGPRGYNGSP